MVLFPLSLGGAIDCIDRHGEEQLSLRAKLDEWIVLSKVHRFSKTVVHSR